MCTGLKDAAKLMHELASNCFFAVPLKGHVKDSAVLDDVNSLIRECYNAASAMKVYDENQADNKMALVQYFTRISKHFDEIEGKLFKNDYVKQGKAYADWLVECLLTSAAQDLLIEPLSNLFDELMQGKFDDQVKILWNKAELKKEKKFWVKEIRLLDKFEVDRIISTCKLQNGAVLSATYETIPVVSELLLWPVSLIE